MKTLLNGVNEILKRVSVIDGNDDELLSLTSSALQIYIDLAVQVANEVLEQLYDLGAPKPEETGEGTLTLVTDTRAYALESDLVELRFPMLDTTNGRYISHYPGGYVKLRQDQPFNNETGIPEYGVIRTTDGYLYLDKSPTSTENGNQYTYWYDKDISLSLASDTFPFSDSAFRAFVPACAEMWRSYRNKEFNSVAYNQSMGRCIRAIRKRPQNDCYLPVKHQTSVTDPFNG